MSASIPSGDGAANLPNVGPNRMRGACLADKLANVSGIVSRRACSEETSSNNQCEDGYRPRRPRPAVKPKQRPCWRRPRWQYVPWPPSDDINRGGGGRRFAKQPRNIPVPWSAHAARADTLTHPSEYFRSSQIPTGYSATTAQIVAHPNCASRCARERPSCACRVSPPGPKLKPWIRTTTISSQVARRLSTRATQLEPAVRRRFPEGQGEYSASRVDPRWTAAAPVRQT